MIYFEQQDLEKFFEAIEAVLPEEVVQESVFAEPPRDDPLIMAIMPKILDVFGANFDKHKFPWELFGALAFIGWARENEWGRVLTDTYS